MTQAQIKDLTRQVEERSVVIDEVNMTTYMLTAKDAYGAIYQISMESWPAVVQIPAPGEAWIIGRRKTSWGLVRRFEVGTEQKKITDLAPGDSRVEAPNDLHLNGTRVKLAGDIEVNGQPLASLFPQPPLPSNTSPLVNGLASPGVLPAYSRGDHVHPTDVSRAPINSPNFTGIPAAPTAAVDTNTTQVATTAYVVGQGYAKLASPTLTGTPAAPTAAVDTNTTQVATTAFVLGQGSGSGDGTPASNGTASRGTSTHYARADHVHPIDTSRTPKITVSTLSGGPPGSPSSGDIWTATAVDSTTGIAWQFCYNASSSSSFKWEFIGGGRVFRKSNGSSGTVDNTWEDINSLSAGAFQQFTLVRAGQYTYRFGGNVNVQGNATQYLGVGVVTGGPILYAPQCQFTSITGDAFVVAGGLAADDVQNGSSRAASDVITLYQQSSAHASTSVLNPWLEITPTRIS